MSSPLSVDAWSSVASIVVIGDSNSEGTGASSVSTRWQQVLQERLRARLQHPGAPGAAVPYISASPRATPPLAGYGRTATAGVTQASFGLGLRAAVVPAGDSVTFTFTGTRARLFGTKGPSVGRYSIRVDGGPETVVDGFNASTIVSGRLIWDSGPLPAGAHTVEVARAASTTMTPGNVFPEGLMTYDGDEAAGVRVVDAARHGTQVSTFTGSTAWHDAFAAVEGKQLLVMAWGANDATAGTTPAAFRAGVETLIAAARSAGFAGTVVLLKMPKRGSVDPAVWADYMAQLDAVAASVAGVVTLDVRARVPDQGTPEAVAGGLYADEVHFSDAGQELIAGVVAEAILAAGWSEPTLAVRVEVAFGADLTADPGTWAWTDLSARMLADPIRIRAGRSGGAGYVSPSTCTLTLDNADGALTPLHPMSPWWPDVQLGTPVRVSVQWAGVWHERFAGFADQWEPTYLPTAAGDAHSVMQVTCSGVLRRLTQGTRPSLSPLRRSISASGVAAYWPAEDGMAASQAASAVPGHPPLRVAGASEFVPIEDSTFGPNPTLRYGTSAVLDLAGGGTMSATVPADVTAATAAAWTVAVVAAVDPAAASGDVVVAEVTTPDGTYVRWQLVVRKATLRTQVVAYTAAGAATTVIDDPGVYTTFNHYDVSARQSGGNIAVGYAWNGTAHSITGSVAGTLAGVTDIAVNPGRATQSSEMPFGHLAVWAAQRIPLEESFTDTYGTFVFGPAYSWNREAATDRLARLCAEEGVPLDMPAVSADAVQRMGWQPPGTLMELLRECEDVDGGILTEQGFGLAYLPREARYNPAPALTVDLSTYCVAGGGQAAVLKPVYDDQGIRNELMVERRDGSSVVVADVASQQRHGIYSDSIDLNLAADEQLDGQAQWRVHLAGEVSLREQTVPIDLAANPGLVAGWLLCGVGSRLVRSHPPAQYGPGPIDRLVEGWTETIGPRSWMVQVTPSPAGPWQVAEVDGAQRIAADGTTLTAAITATATTAQITSTAANGPWTTDPADFPLDVRIGGEQVTLTSITGTGLTQTATIAARGVNGVIRSWPAGTEVDVWQPAIAAL